MEHVCPQCGKTFVEGWDKRKRTFCSHACSGTYHVRPIPERFWAKVDKSAGENGCWIWTGADNGDGYGTFKADHSARAAHRVSWELANGPITNNLCVLHRCDNRRCVNPAHLFLGTRQDNAIDMCAKDRQAKGVDHSCVKLTEEQVREIRRRYASGEMDGVHLAKAYGISNTNIYCILSRQTWRHI